MFVLEHIEIGTEVEVVEHTENTDVVELVLDYTEVVVVVVDAVVMMDKKPGDNCLHTSWN